MQEKDDVVNIIVDTSVFIDFARANKGLYLDILELGSGGDARLFVPTVAIMEYWAGRNMRLKGMVGKAEILFRKFDKIDLTESIAKKAGELIRENSVVESVDSIVAATALYLDAQLATSNKEHFEKVKGLKLFRLQKS